MVQYSRDRGYNYNCMSGDQDHLYDRLKESIVKARKIDIIVAFLMESGVRLLVKDLKEAVDKGTVLRILCGNYLNITQPQALYLLKGSLGDKIDLRFYNVPNKSFHPKAYIFEYKDVGEIYVGSSNMSRSALMDGIEWNYRICSSTSLEDYDYFKQSFEELFLNKSIIIDDNEMRQYSKSWKRPKLFEDLEKLENGNQESESPNYSKAAEPLPEFIIDSEGSGECKVIEYPFPKGPQIEALYELKRSRLEGWDKGIVVAATGVGKTFLAVFDSVEFDKVLFIAHREEILIQAESTFKCVRPGKSTGFFSGDKKDRNCDILLATVQTLGRKEYLDTEYFLRDTFDYIVIDEFHHAVADSYRHILEYFKPRFLLGLTATPERLDSQDVFALCDYNLIYEARLKEAINKGWLVPFRYYGVYDETDYTSIDYRNGKYDEKQLEKVLSISIRADLILQHYLKYNSRRALGFCSSRGHAVFMAEYFKKHGVKACAVISGSTPTFTDDSENRIKSAYVLERKDALEKLKNAEINILFSVDMFNEGLDIPGADMVMLLRPTESPTVFLQQLGRGLRKKGNKKYLNVLDFIGNYKKANLIPYLLMGDGKNTTKKSNTVKIPDEDEYPDDCFVSFDFRLIDLFKRMEAEQQGAFEKLKAEYYRIRAAIGDRPLRLGMYTYLDEVVYLTIRTRRELNIFRDYISFLERIDELSYDEKALVDTIAHKFLKEMENTNMSKLYKMPLLLAFYNTGNIKMEINEDDIYESFKEFYSHGSNAIDLLKHDNTRNYKDWGKREYVSLARRNPMKYFMHSSPDFFYEVDNKFCLTPKLKEFIENLTFIRHFKDIIDYKTRRFYKERLENTLADANKLTEEVDESIVRFALRDEYVNVMAMTRGGVEAKYKYQVITCKKSPISNENGLFLLDAKKSAPTYNLSIIGKNYNESLTEKHSEHEQEYAARIDSQLKVKVNPELFNQLYKEGLFPIWAPEAPLKYFEGCEIGYLVIFRVFKLNRIVSDGLLEKGRKGRNYIFRLNEEAIVEIGKPVISDEEFSKMKDNILSLLESNDWLA